MSKQTNCIIQVSTHKKIIIFVLIFRPQITFSIDVENFGVTKTCDLKENGRNIAVTDQNKLEYVQLVCQTKLTESIKEQVCDASIFGRSMPQLAYWSI